MTPATFMAAYERETAAGLTTFMLFADGKSRLIIGFTGEFIACGKRVPVETVNWSDEFGMFVTTEASAK